MDAEMERFTSWAQTVRDNGVPVEEVAARWTLDERVTKWTTEAAWARAQLAEGIGFALEGVPVGNLDRLVEAAEQADAERQSAVEDARALLADSQCEPTERALTRTLERAARMNGDELDAEIEGLDEALLDRLANLEHGREH
jgi:hypothetical protein